MRIRFFYILICCSYNLIGQNNHTANLIRNYKFEDAKVSLEGYSSLTKQTLLWQIDFIENYPINSPKFHSIKTLAEPSEPIGQFYRMINLGDYYLFGFPDKTITAIEYYKKALDFSLKTNNEIYVCTALDKILYLYRQIYFYENNTFEEYLELYQKHTHNTSEEAYFQYYKLTFEFKNYDLNNWNGKTERTLDSLLIHLNDNYLLKGDVNFVKAIYFEEKKDQDSTLYYINKTIADYNQFPYKSKKIRLNQLFSYKARIALKWKNHESASQSLQMISDDSNNLMNYKTNGQKLYYTAIMDTFTGDLKAPSLNIINMKT